MVWRYSAKNISAAGWDGLQTKKVLKKGLALRKRRVAQRKSKPA